MQFRRLKQLSAAFTLVPARIGISALWARTAHIPVGKKTLTAWAIQLPRRMLRDITVFIEAEKNILRNIRLLRRRGTPKMVEGNMKPTVYILMQRMIIVAKFAGSFMLLLRLRFGRRAVFIGAAHIKRLVAAASAKTRKNIGGKYLNEISKMRDIVYIR